MFGSIGQETEWSFGRFRLIGMLGDSSNVRYHRHEASGLAVLFWGRLDNQAELMAVLGINRTESAAELLAHAWLKWGEHCAEQLVGDFAFAVADHKAGTLFLARDALGVKPLYYQIDETGVRFAVTAAAIKALDPSVLTRSRQWMAKYLLDLSWSQEATAYDEISKLPAAHCLFIQADGRCRMRRYHQFINDAPVAAYRDPMYLEAYRGKWQEAVRCRMPSHGKIASENSGGLDSGSITAEIARRLGPDSDRLHSMGFCREPLEPEYIMATAMQYQLRNNILYSHSLSRDWPKIRTHELQVNGYPQEHANGSSHFPFYMYCREQGISNLFSGFGGDEVVTHPVGMTARFELFDQRNWPALWKVLPGGTVGRSARFARNILRASAAMPSQNAGLLEAFRGRWPYQFLTAEAVESYELDGKYFDSATYDEGFRNVNDAAIYLLGRPFAATRLENCSLMAASFGIEYAWPLLDRRLVQQWLSTPVIWKVGDNGIGRYLHRRAAEGVCPDRVNWKPNKDMGFADSIQKMETADNRPVFRRLLELLEALPQELESLVDKPRLVRFAGEAIKNDLRGEVVNYSVPENIDRLESLVEWLSTDVVA
jgi:asparagine synthase (glutamine-hydrolysing)